MKNGSRETRLKARGSFGGSIKAERTINYKKKVIKDKKVVGLKAAKRMVKRDYKGAAGSKLTKRYRRTSALM